MGKKKSIKTESAFARQKNVFCIFLKGLGNVQRCLKLDRRMLPSVSGDFFGVYLFIFSAEELIGRVLSPG